MSSPAEAGLTHEIFAGLFSLAISKLDLQEYFLTLRKCHCPSPIQSFCLELRARNVIPTFSPTMHQAQLQRLERRYRL